MPPPSASRQAPPGPRDRCGFPSSTSSGGATSRATGCSPGRRGPSRCGWRSTARSTPTGTPAPATGVCSSARTVGVRSRSSTLDGTTRTLVDRVGGVRLNSPNDVVEHSDGSIWFTDPNYGLTSPGEGLPRRGGVRRPVRVPARPRTGDTACGGHRPRPAERAGVLARRVGALCRRQRALAGADPCLRRARRRGDARAGWCGWSSPASPTVSGSTPRAGSGRPARTPCRCSTPTGRCWRRVPVPETVSNVCFGGPDGTDLFVTATTSLYRIRTQARDAAAAG